MEENKNLNPELEELEIQSAEISADETVTEDPSVTTKVKKEKTPKKPKKEKLIKNQALFKKGSYSIAITAIVLVGIIVFNVLVGALSDRFVLEFDMTADKVNSITQENIDYIKSVDEDITVTVCASQDGYSNYMAYYAQQYGVNDSTGATIEYYNQTVNLINKYNAYNKNITIDFVDTQSSEFTAISAKYADANLTYGDIIVSKENKDGTTRYKKIGYEDIYNLETDQNYAAYGMTVNTITGNRIETALTSAISYVANNQEKNAIVFTGHSSADYTEGYRATLKTNNYNITVVDDALITEIPNDTNLIVFAGPSKDFLESEIKVINDFLNNGGKLGKGMVVFADATAPYLENFYDFLSQWGIELSEGILFETNQQNYIPDDPTTMGSYHSEAFEELKDMTFCISGYNVPLKPTTKEPDYVTVNPIMITPDSVVAAPKGTTANWKGADKYTKDSYATVLESVKSNYDDDNNEIESRIAIFSSVEFLTSQYNETQSVSNKDITLAMTERSCGIHSEVFFLSKSITNESFADSVTASSAKVIQIIFMWLLPILTIAAGIYIFIKRRNAE